MRYAGCCTDVPAVHPCDAPWSPPPSCPLLIHMLVGRPKNGAIQKIREGVVGLVMFHDFAVASTCGASQVPGCPADPCEPPWSPNPVCHMSILILMCGPRNGVPRTCVGPYLGLFDFDCPTPGLCGTQAVVQMYLQFIPVMPPGTLHPPAHS